MNLKGAYLVAEDGIYKVVSGSATSELNESVEVIHDENGKPVATVAFQKTFRLKKTILMPHNTDPVATAYVLSLLKGK